MKYDSGATGRWTLLMLVVAIPLYGQDCELAPDCGDNPCIVAVSGECVFKGDFESCGDGLFCFDTQNYPDPKPEEQYACLPLVCDPSTCASQNADSDCLDSLCLNTPGGASCSYAAKEDDFLSCNNGAGVCVKDDSGGARCETNDACLRRGYGRINCCSETDCETPGTASTCPEVDPAMIGRPCDPTGVLPPAAEGEPSTLTGTCVAVAGTLECVSQVGPCAGESCEDGDDCSQNRCDPETGTCGAQRAIPQGVACTTEFGEGGSCQPDRTCERTNQCSGLGFITDVQCCDFACDDRNGSGACFIDWEEGNDCSALIDGVLSPEPDGKCSAIPQPMVSEPAFFRTRCIPNACAIRDPNDPGEDPDSTDDDGWIDRCDDGLECTADVCDANTGACTNTPVTDYSLCDFGSGVCIQTGSGMSECKPIPDPCTGAFCQEFECSLAFSVSGLGGFYVPDCTTPTVMSAISTRKIFGSVIVDGRNLITLRDTSMNGPMFEVMPGATLDLRNIVLEQGRDASGGAGAILNEGTLILSGVTIVNSEGGPEPSGPIVNRGSMTMRDSTISSNTAVNGTAGIYNTGTVRIINSDLSGNVVSAGPEQVALGGALYNEGVATIEGSTFSNNEAAEGGAIYNLGDLAVTASDFDDNVAAGRGGAIVNVSGATMSVYTSTMSRNDAGGDGGAIFQDETSSMLVVQSRLRINDAGLDGGAIWAGGTVTLSAATIVRNTAQGSGGGARFVGPKAFIDVISSTFSINKARDSSCGGGNSEGGGAIRFTGGLAGMTIVNSTFARNDGCESGAILMSENANLAIFSSTISDNTTRVGGATVLNAEGGVTVQNSILDGTCNIEGQPTSDGGNVQTDASCELDDPTDQTVADADLLPLADRGGFTETMGPRPTSPAVDAVPDGQCVEPDGTPLNFDQIRTSRPQGALCDAGSVELLP